MKERHLTPVTKGSSCVHESLLLKLLTLSCNPLALLSHAFSHQSLHTSSPPLPPPTPPISPFSPFSSSFILRSPLRLKRRCSLRRLIPLLWRLVRLRRRAPASWSLQHVSSARMLRLYVGSVTAAGRKGFVSYDPGFSVYIRTCIA